MVNILYYEGNLRAIEEMAETGNITELLNAWVSGDMAARELLSLLSTRNCIVWRTIIEGVWVRAKPSRQPLWCSRAIWRSATESFGLFRSSLAISSGRAPSMAAADSGAAMYFDQRQTSRFRPSAASLNT